MPENDLRSMGHQVSNGVVVFEVDEMIGRYDTDPDRLFTCLITRDTVAEEAHGGGTRVHNWEHGTVNLTPPGSALQKRLNFTSPLSAKVVGHDLSFIEREVPVRKPACGKLSWFVERSIKDPVAAHLIQALVVTSGDDVDPVMPEYLSMALWCRIVQWMDDSPQRMDGTSSQIMRAIDYIRENLHTRLLVEDVAKASALSVFHFTRTFRQAVGVTPHRYIINSRVERAKRMIARGYGLAEISYSCGFSSQPQLTRHFSEVTGMTPGEFRRSTRE